MQKAVLTLAERIDRARDGRSNKWVIEEMNKLLPKPDHLKASLYSHKKHGSVRFSKTEISALSKVLGVEISID